MRALAGRSSPQARFSRTVIFVAVVLDDLNTRFIACTLLHFPYIEETSDFLLTLLLERLCTFALRRTLLHVGVHSFFDIYLLIHQALIFFFTAATAWFFRTLSDTFWAVDVRRALSSSRCF